MSAVQITDVAPAVDIAVPTAIQETQPHVKPLRARSNIIDTRYVPLSHIVVNAAGTPWTVDFFGQVLGEDTEVGPVQFNGLAVYNQYVNIKHLEIRVDEPLKEVIDPETNETRIEGTAKWYNNIYVNVGDAFLVDIGDGREGVFQVTEVNKGSSFQDALYRATYVLIDYAEGTAAYREQLEVRVVDTKVFDKELLSANKNPLLVDADYVTRDKVKYEFTRSVRSYLKDFYSREHRTLIVPGDNLKIYDRFLIKFLQAVLDTVDNPEVKHLTALNISDGEGVDAFQIWTAIKELDEGLVDIINQKMWVLLVNAFNRIPYFASIRYSGLDGVLYPNNSYPGIVGNVATGYGSAPWVVVDENHPDFEAYDPLPDFVNVLNEDLEVAPPMIHPVTRDDYYILSNEFYNNLEGQSALEIILRKVMRKETIKHQWLLDLANASKDWRSLDRFYYLPIIIALLKNSSFHF